MMRKILVFDSGVGGFSIVNSLENANFAINIDYVADTEFFPYGDKSDLDLLVRIPKIVKLAVEKSQADAVIIACNTASTIALFAIREVLKIPIIGVVPAIKPAAILSKTKTIGLLATPRTIGSAYTDQLIEDFAQNIRVIRYGAPLLARAAESFILGQGLDEIAIKQSIDGLFDHENGHEIDVIVLACTHYPLVGAQLAKLAPKKVQWIDSGDAIAKRAANLLNLGTGKIVKGRAFSSGGEDAKFCEAAIKFGFGNIEKLRVEI
jgi:glutamate racemase